jgi:hypothetical protein
MLCFRLVCDNLIMQRYGNFTYELHFYIYSYGIKIITSILSTYLPLNLKSSFLNINKGS